uniref:Uncharacterized protein n=1 Tax=Tetranychus urticae TaxID=32264 RepID=T1K1W9_TETUR
MKTLNKINRRQPIPPVPSFQSVDISRISSMPTSGFNERKTRTKSRFATLMCLFAKGPGKGKSKSNLPVPVQFSKFSLGSSTGFNINSARITVEPESESLRNNPTELKISRVPLTGPPKAKVKFLKEKSQPQKPTKSKLKPKVTTKSGFNMQKVKTISPKKVDPPKLVTKSNKSQRKLVKPKVEAKKSKAK